MSENLNVNLANIDASLSTLAGKLQNLGIGVETEITQFQLSQSQLSAKVEELAALVASGNPDKERAESLQSEVNSLNAAANDAANRAASLAARISEIGVTVDSLDARLLSDDPSPAIPDLPDAPDEVAAIEDAEEESGDEEDANAETKPPVIDAGESVEVQTGEPVESTVEDPLNPPFGSRRRLH